MLPAYLSYFLGLEESGTAGAASSRPGQGAVARALGVGSVMTLGFVAVFGAVGLVVSGLSTSIVAKSMWATIVIGLVLVALGIFLLSGRELTVKLPKLDRGGTSRELPSMLLFGISYAIASLSCTLPAFLAATSSTFNRSGVLSGLVTFIAYGVGMGLIITALTLAVALARGSIVRLFRRAMPFVSRASGLLVLIAGLYVAYYGYYEVRLARGGAVEDPVIDRALALQAALSGFVDRIGTGRLGLICLVVVVSALTATWLIRRHRIEPS